MWERFTRTSPLGAVVTAALDEARRRGDRKVGTDHLLLGLLHDPQQAGALGVTVEEARAALTDLDRDALACIGLDVRGLEPAGLPRPARSALSRNTLTAGARTVLTRAVESNGGKTKGLEPEHLLRSVLTCAPPEPAAALLARLGVDPSAARNGLDRPGT